MGYSRNNPLIYNRQSIFQKPRSLRAGLYYKRTKRNVRKVFGPYILSFFLLPHNNMKKILSLIVMIAAFVSAASAQTYSPLYGTRLELKNGSHKTTIYPPSAGGFTPLYLPIDAPANGEVLVWNTGGILSWEAASGSGTVTSVSGSGGTTGLTLTGGAITTTGTLTLGGTLVAANGGTGVSSLSGQTGKALVVNAGETGYTFATIGGGALTNFTEAINTAAPNATVPVASLTATNAATDVDAAFIPKGNGAILADMPDNAATGGNKRGTNAVDLQIVRADATQVASGYVSTIGGGERNTASSFYSTVSGGYNNTSNGSRSTIGGGGNNGASGSYSTVGGGGSNGVSGGFSSIGGGSGNTVSGDMSTIAGGYGNSASGDYSAILGGRGLTLDASADGSFGFLGNNSTGSTDMTISAANTAVFGNTDLWLGNNDGSTQADASQLRFYEPNATTGAFPSGGTHNYAALRAPASLGANYVLTLPLDDGTASGQVLSTDGAGVLSWISAGLSGGTNNVITKWTSATTVGTSSITDDATDVSTTSNLKLTGSNKQLSFKGNSTGVTTFVAGTQGATSINYTLPTTVPTVGQVLVATAVSGSNVTLGWTYVTFTITGNNTGNNWSTSSTEYAFINQTGNNPGTTFTDFDVVLSSVFNITIREIHVTLSGVPSTGDSYTFDITDAAANLGSNNLTIPDISTTGSLTGQSYSIPAGTAVALRCVPTSDPDARTATWTIIATID
jgi:hypothetical protein